MDVNGLNFLYILDFLKIGQGIIMTTLFIPVTAEDHIQGDTTHLLNLLCMAIMNVLIAAKRILL